MKKLAILFSFIATPAYAGDFTYPKVFSVYPDETIEQAQDRYNDKRTCAYVVTGAGIVAGTALDAVTSNSNQKHGYKEINLAYGKKATTEEIIAFHAVSGAFIMYLTHKEAQKDPYGACKKAKINAGLMLLPGVVNLVVRIGF